MGNSNECLLVDHVQRIALVQACDELGAAGVLKIFLGARFTGCSIPIVSIVVPFFWINQIYIKDPKG